jgi:hypothetical protein
VLTPNARVHSIDQIEIGRHGLIIEQGHRRGLLLPQVATEYRWNRETFSRTHLPQGRAAARRLAPRREDPDLRSPRVWGGREVGSGL